MKVFQVNTVYGSGSTGRIVADLKHILEEKGEACYVAYGRGSVSEEQTCHVGSRPDLYAHALLTRATDRAGCFSVRPTRRLIKKIMSFQPDIIHLHNIHGYYVNIGLLFRFLKAYGRPVVWTFHDCWPFTGHCVHFEEYGSYGRCEKWKVQCRECARSLEYPKSLTDGSKWNYQYKKRVFTEYGNLAIVTVSDWLKQQVRSSFFGDFPVRTIYNGVDLGKFKPRDASGLREKYHLGHKKVVLGVASTWSLLKGLKDFIKLAGFLDHEKYKIVLLGVDEKQGKSMPPEILALPCVEGAEELAGWYSAAEVYFSASRAETFGMTVMEALACGTPVVAYDICAMRELLDGRCGFLAQKAGDVEEAAGLITRCDKGRMKAACLERSRMFEKGLQYEKYVELYRSIVDCGRE